MRYLADIGSTFGNITPPSPIAAFAAGNPTGAAGISSFLSNLIGLIYIFAAIALLAMLLWGAFDWIISEGDKEKVTAARNKIIHAIIGIMLFAIAFAILSILGAFTGFSFFTKGGIPKTHSECYNHNTFDSFNNPSLCIDVVIELCRNQRNKFSTPELNRELDNKCSASDVVPLLAP